jgi:hypothetical protein
MSQGGVIPLKKKPNVAWMKRSVIQERVGSGVGIPGFSPFHPGYRLVRVNGAHAALHDLKLFGDKGNTLAQLDEFKFVGANDFQVARLLKGFLQLLHAVEP